ncbi:hypothetical protein R1sor_011474 [Riccia sorocarpa]|uniref:Uncharacterized protein n=1 Tax=Riccia sorocarpa TaxID=122646 RepID=A0ABD3I126_9MARC
MVSTVQVYPVRIVGSEVPGSSAQARTLDFAVALGYTPDSAVPGCTRDFAVALGYTRDSAVPGCTRDSAVPGCTRDLVVPGCTPGFQARYPSRSSLPARACILPTCVFKLVGIYEKYKEIYAWDVELLDINSNSVKRDMVLRILLNAEEGKSPVAENLDIIWHAVPTKENSIVLFYENEINSRLCRIPLSKTAKEDLFDRSGTEQETMASLGFPLADSSSLNQWVVNILNLRKKLVDENISHSRVWDFTKFFEAANVPYDAIASVSKTMLFLRAPVDIEDWACKAYATSRNSSRGSTKSGEEQGENSNRALVTHSSAEGEDSPTQAQEPAEEVTTRRKGEVEEQSETRVQL